MKKFILICFICMTCAGLSFAEPLKQFQTFYWSRVTNAKKYEIVIERYNDDGNYVPELSQQLTDNNIELLLYPGSYRVAISSFNVLGRKASTSEWTNFIILDEKEPYLYADTFKKSKRWNSPVLNIKASGVQIVQEGNEEGEITARAGDPTNSFFIKGKNIFFEETSFSLVPKKDEINGKPFECFVESRYEVPLKIVRRDTENSGVVVEYDPEALFSGYYDVVVKNPGEEETSLEILVLSYQPPKIDVSSFKYDENYNVHMLNVNQGGFFVFDVTGTGFDSSSIYSMAPDSSLPPYPFASAYENRESTSVTLFSHKSLDDNGKIQLSLSMNASKLHTGYYRFEVNNGASGSDSVILLINVMSAFENKPEISKIKTKVLRSSDAIQFEINSFNINKDSKLTFVSPYSSEKGGNEKISVEYLITKKNGKVSVLQCSKKKIEPGKYVLLVENNQNITRFYFDVDEKYKFTQIQLSENEVTSLFCKPKNVIAKKTPKKLNRTLKLES